MGEVLHAGEPDELGRSLAWEERDGDVVLLELEFVGDDLFERETGVTLRDLKRSLDGWRANAEFARLLRLLEDD